MSGRGNGSASGRKDRESPVIAVQKSPAPAARQFRDPAVLSPRSGVGRCQRAIMPTIAAPPRTALVLTGAEADRHDPHRRTLGSNRAS